MCIHHMVRKSKQTNISNSMVAIFRNGAMVHCCVTEHQSSNSTTIINFERVIEQERSSYSLVGSVGIK
jgi:hypothetical protein